jgi:hypothetical protein
VTRGTCNTVIRTHCFAVWLMSRRRRSAACRGGAGGQAGRRAGGRRGQDNVTRRVMNCGTFGGEIDPRLLAFLCRIINVLHECAYILYLSI